MDKVVQAEGTDKLRNKLKDSILWKSWVCLMKGGGAKIKMCFKWEMMGPLDQSGETSMDLREIYQKMISSLGNLDSNHNHSILPSPWSMHFDSLLHLCILHRKSYLWGYHNSYI